MILSLSKAFITDGYRENVSYEIDLSGYEYGNGFFPFVKPVSVSGLLYNSADTLHLSVSARYSFTTVCDRCAEPVEIERNINNDIVLVREKFGEDADDSIIAVPDERFDLDAFITENILLDVPAKFLCSEDCKGLCGSCGKNLNLGACECRHQSSPFEVLKQFFND